MHRLQSRTPLGAAAARSDTIGTLTIAEITDVALVSVSARNDQEPALRAALATAVGLDLPEVGQSATADDLSAFWTGPSQWMCAAPYEGGEVLCRQIKHHVGASASVVDQTDAWCRFDVSGAQVFDLFERLTKAPVRSMAPGAACRTGVEHLGVYLWCQSATHWAVIGPRSSAGSLHHALMAAARSIC
ncbi:sarcosine oxidase subunit gamma [Phaeobacter sp.]|uniref:sarcosine oxidase subunit gamma n=1 Tax=Phaeobacter sp. TaxID=1902409 RepID=UPI0025DA5FBD|nr:sarcosine oxidase subunit gamma [Phaeobacter sp.]